MATVSDQISAFFERYNAANNAFDPDLLGDCIGGTLVGADPSGEVLALEKGEFLAGINERKDYLDAMGFVSVNVYPYEEVPLNETYTLVKTRGRMAIKKQDGEVVELVHDASYILFLKEDGPKMVFALSHEDPMKMMQDQGLA
jgi:hypothetical protein